VPSAFVIRSCRPPIVVIAAWLLMLQAFLAGVAIAQAGVLRSFEGMTCHGVDSSHPATSQAERALHLCCAGCTSPDPAGVSPEPQQIVERRLRRHPRPAESESFTIVLARGLVRAGQSQAPPSPA
jgi:hypothetical protein